MYIHEVTKAKKYARKHWDDMYMSSICTFPELKELAKTSRYFLPTVFSKLNENVLKSEGLYYLTIEDVEADDWFILEK